MIGLLAFKHVYENDTFTKVPRKGDTYFQRSLLSNLFSIMVEQQRHIVDDQTLIAVICLTRSLSSFINTSKKMDICLSINSTLDAAPAFIEISRVYIIPLINGICLVNRITIWA